MVAAALGTHAMMHARRSDWIVQRALVKPLASRTSTAPAICTARHARTDKHLQQRASSRLSAQAAAHGAAGHAGVYSAMRLGLTTQERKLSCAVTVWAAWHGMAWHTPERSDFLDEGRIACLDFPELTWKQGITQGGLNIGCSAQDW